MINDTCHASWIRLFSISNFHYLDDQQCAGMICLFKYFHLYNLMVQGNQSSSNDNYAPWSRSDFTSFEYWPHYNPFPLKRLNCNYCINIKELYRTNLPVLRSRTRRSFEPMDSTPSESLGISYFILVNKVTSFTFHKAQCSSGYNQFIYLQRTVWLSSIGSCSTGMNFSRITTWDRARGVWPAFMTSVLLNQYNDSFNLLPVELSMISFPSFTEIPYIRVLLCGWTSEVFFKFQQHDEHWVLHKTNVFSKSLVSFLLNTFTYYQFSTISIITFIPNSLIFLTTNCVQAQRIEYSHKTKKLHCMNSPTK